MPTNLHATIQTAITATAGDNPPALRLKWIHEASIALLTELLDSNPDAIAIAELASTIMIQSRRYGTPAAEYSILAK